jgi:hypothetical protein
MANEKHWYDTNVFVNILWFISGIVWLPIYVVTIPMKERPKWLRWWTNRVDNIVDQGKEWLHCRKIPFTNKQINISFMMKNRTTTWDIIREHKKWSNCDPEDFA